MSTPKASRSGAAVRPLGYAPTPPSPTARVISEWTLTGAAHINTYLPWRSEHAVDDSDTSPLPIRPDGRALTRDPISYRVSRLYARAGIAKPEGEAAHALCRTYAVSMADAGVPISEVRQLLSHESIATTGIYLKTSAAHLRTASTAPSAARLLASKLA